MQTGLLIQALKDYGIAPHKIVDSIVFEMANEQTGASVPVTTVKRLASAYGGHCKFKRDANGVPIVCTITPRR